ncbi:MAG: NfeD family protein [Clostridia bacterium]|nr:NfeD family protein [Clostridia bacterium]
MDTLYVYSWLGLMLILIAIEASTISLTTIWLAAGSLVAFFLALFNVPLWIQILAFLVVSSVLLIFTRPVAVKYLKVGTHKTNLDALIGLKGLVIMDISEHTTGQVKLKGQIWSAMSKDGSSISNGSTDVVEAIEGVKLIVSK